MEFEESKSINLAILDYNDSLSNKDSSSLSDLCLALLKIVLIIKKIPLELLIPLLRNIVVDSCRRL